VDNSGSRPEKRGNSICVIETRVVRNFAETELELVISRDGSAGAYRRTWPMEHGFLSASQATDLATFVARTLHDALWTFHGTQTELPL